MSVHYFSDGTTIGGQPLPALRAAAMSAAAPARADVAILVTDADTQKKAREQFHERVMARVAKGQTARQAISDESLHDPATAVDYVTHGGTAGHDAERPIVRANPTAFAQRVREVAQEKGVSHRDAIRVVSLSDPLAARAYESGESLRAVARPASRPTPTPTSTAAERAFVDAAHEVARTRRLDLSSAVRVVAKERRDLMDGYCGAFHLAGH
jgi:hypothetical protein